jgi:hypothetical protein
MILPDLEDDRDKLRTPQSKSIFDLYTSHLQKILQPANWHEHLHPGGICMLVATLYESGIKRSRNLKRVGLLPPIAHRLTFAIPTLISVQTSFFSNVNPALEDPACRALDGQGYAPRLIFPVSPGVFDDVALAEMNNRCVLSQLCDVWEQVLQGLSKRIAVNDVRFGEPHQKLGSHGRGKARGIKRQCVGNAESNQED